MIKRNQSGHTDNQEEINGGWNNGRRGINKARQPTERHKLRVQMG